MSVALKDFKVDYDTVEAALTPSSAVAKEYMSPIQDDTWVRQTQIVDVDKIIKDEGTKGAKMVSKEKVVSAYTGGRSDTIAANRNSDPVLEGIMWQEKFMAEYKQQSVAMQDKSAASDYKKKILSSYRQKQTKQLE